MQRSRLTELDGELGHVAPAIASVALGVTSFGAIYSNHHFGFFGMRPALVVFSPTSKYPYWFRTNVTNDAMT